MRLMMDILAALATGLWQTIKALFRGLRGLLLAFMLVLNLAMIAVPMVYDMASRVFWGVVSIASEGYASRVETRAVRRAYLDQIEADRVRLRGGRGRLDQRIRTVEAELDVARQRETSALAQLDEVKLDRRRLTAQTQGLADELVNNRAANRQIQNQVAGTVRHMQRRSMKAVARNTGEAYAESIPVLGTVFVIGGIALDVWDTCQTMKDMHEIERLMEFSSKDENEIETRWCGGKLPEIWAALGGGPTAPQRACIEARLRTVETAPPECEGFELPRGDPFRSADPQPEQVPLRGTNPMRE